ncbi:MAG: AarF/ABC1/UbiB kinase family protein [Deltaproteobacteria bacterium]|nr:AarF/ABC1/UbiB kinase family protein [Deltaproteobacteria bacterium]
MAGRRLDRLTRLGGLTGKVTRSYLQERLKGVLADEEERARLKRRFQLEAAEQIAEQLGQLRGAAMKVGQGLAAAAGAIDLPEEVVLTLSRLNREAPPVPYRWIAEDIESSLGRPITSLFASINPRPIGTASLGQAHAGVLHTGRPVVVKVLHRGTLPSLQTDLTVLRALLRSGKLLRRSGEELDQAFEEISARLHEETDYLQEAANIAQFQRLLRDREGVKVPALVPALCSDRVLTMDLLPGVPLQEFLCRAAPEAHARAGHTLGGLFFEMVFRHRTLHADPHPGNFLFQEDGTVGLVDFGCVKRFDEFWIAHYARAALAGVDGDSELALAAARDLGAWRGNSPQAGRLLWSFIDTIAAPFRAEEYTIGAAEHSVMERLRPTLRRLPMHAEIAVPPDLIYLHRALAGLYAIARRLVVRAPWGALLRREAEYAVNFAEGRLPSTGSADEHPR